MKSVSLPRLLEAAGLSSQGTPDVAIADLAYDSRLISKNFLFLAIQGVHADGHRFIGAAREQGAAAALVEKKQNDPLPQIVVPSVMAAMSKISAAFFDHPSKRIPVIGVTGTNGKTTTTYLIEDLLRNGGQTCGVMGTVNYRIGKDERPAPNTTPMSLDVQRFLNELTDKKINAGLMEVSSHALELNRVDDVQFAIAVFTNLTQDHLDFHKDMENYFNAKAKLFRRKISPRPVINVDDPYGERLAKEFPQAMTYGAKEEAMLRVKSSRTDLAGIHFTLAFPSKKEYSISTNLMGLHNVYNCVAAAGAMAAHGMEEEKIVEGLNGKHGVPGRLERVEAGQNFVVVVDYAHTHDALAQVLRALRAAGPRELHCVFGAGGDRDKTKRPRMGQVAVELADRVIVTSDNPRTEDPQLIMKDIEAGIRATGKQNYAMLEDREAAIRFALKKAQAGDIVLIAGKGHENYQIFKDKRIHFSDVETALNILRS